MNAKFIPPTVYHQEPQLLYSICRKDHPLAHLERVCVDHDNLKNSINRYFWSLFPNVVLSIKI